MDEMDKKIVYYYRNNFPRKDICEKLKVDISFLERRITKLRKQGLLKRWWEE